MARGKKEESVNLLEQEEIEDIVTDAEATDTEVIDEEVIDEEAEESIEDGVEADLEGASHEAICKECLLYNGVYYNPGDLVAIEEEEIYNRLITNNVIE